jgi:hypothetical protein
MGRRNLFSRTGALACLLALLFTAAPTNLPRLHAAAFPSPSQEESERGSFEGEEKEATMAFRRSASRLPRKRTADPSPLPATVSSTPLSEDSSPLPLLSARPAGPFAKRNQVGTPLRC